MARKRGTNEDDLLNAALEAELLQVTEKKKKKLAQATKTKAKPKKKKKAWEDDDEEDDADFNESEEEGEAPLSDGEAEKPAPKKSAAMPLKKRKVADEAEPVEASDDSAEFDDGFDSDLQGDEEDRRKLAAMNEIEREAVLTERFEKRKALQERREARRKAREAEGKKSSKDTRRDKLRTSVSGTRGKTATALDAYKKAKSAATRGDKIPQTPSKDESDRRDDEEEEEEEEPEPTKKPERKAPSRPQVPPAERITVDELNGCRLTRSQLEKWADQPFFERTLPGLFVRVGIGVSKLVNERVYRVCEIVEVKDGHRTYALGSKKTNKTLLVKHGVASKAFTMDVISNTPFTDSELNRWLHELGKYDIASPTKEELKELKEKLDKARNYVYTDADIDEMVSQNDKLRQRPISIARRKAQLLAKRVSEMNLGNPVEEIDKELKELDELAREAAAAEQERITAIERINVKNRERESSIADAARVEQEQQARAAASGDLNPFSRRPTAPSVMYVPKAEVDAMMKKKKEEATQKKEEPKPTQPPPSAADKLRASVDEMDDDALMREREAMRVSLDINLDSKQPAFKAPNPPPPKPLPAVHLPSEVPKKTLSLAEYKRRMGLV